MIDGTKPTLMLTKSTVHAIPAPLWSADEVATFLGMSKKWVYKHADLGNLPCVRMGPAVRFRPEAIRAYLAEHEHSPRGRRPTPAPAVG